MKLHDVCRWALIGLEEILIDHKEESTFPLGMATHNTEITLGKSAKLAKAVGAAVELIAKKGKSATFNYFLGRSI